MKNVLSVLLSLLLIVFSMFTVSAADDGAIIPAAPPRSFRLLFTHDIHSYLAPVTENREGGPHTFGGAARLKTLLDLESAGSESLYVDGGDFSQGTLFQSAYRDNAAELQILGQLGCAYTTLGNHEWDLDGTGLSEMLENAMKSGGKLPGVLCSNLDFSGTLSEEQSAVQNTLEKMSEYTGTDSYEMTVRVLKNGLRVGIFGLSGISSIEDSPTSGMNFIDYIDRAKTIVSKLKPKCDVLLCLSHCGTDGDRENGEDIDLAKACPEINIIISAHSHSAYQEPLLIGSTLIASAGCYLENLGSVSVDVSESGVSFSDYRLCRIDENVKEDPEIQKSIEELKATINKTYLQTYGDGRKYDQKIAYCDFNFTSLDDMYIAHDEYPMGNLIADSYLYEARQNGIHDIDVALVGLGTIRGSFSKGPIRVSDAFQICSLGKGLDGSAGHPLLGAYITGKELKLLLELDASLGPLVSSIKMSYAGLRYSFNTRRVLLDRVTECFLVREDGTEEPIEDQRLYKVCCNMYAANMLGMLNDLTKGILKIVPKYQDGNVITDLYDVALTNAEGKEIKEWTAFVHYLSSFEEDASGLPAIPLNYATKEGRKYKYEDGGVDAVRHPGGTTLAVGLFGWIVILIIILILVKRYKKKHADEIPKKRHRTYE